jgi:hypothetical protein
MADNVVVRRDPFNFFGFEVEGILGDENGRVGTAFQTDGATGVFESAAPRADVKFRLLSFDVLIVEIKLDVTAGGGLRGDAVVLHVIGLKAKVAVMDVDVPIGQIKVALFGLRAAGGNLGDRAGSGRDANLLGIGKGGGEQNQPKRGQGAQSGIGKKYNHAANWLDKIKK